MDDDFAAIWTNMYDGMWLNDLNEYELRFCKRLEKAGYLTIVTDLEIGDREIRKTEQ
jgi:hypothetical protein